jgi:hypothetical protein
LCHSDPIRGVHPERSEWAQGELREPASHSVIPTDVVARSVTIVVEARNERSAVGIRRSRGAPWWAGGISAEVFPDLRSLDCARRLAPLGMTMGRVLAPLGMTMGRVFAPLGMTMGRVLAPRGMTWGVGGLACTTIVTRSVTTPLGMTEVVEQPSLAAWWSTPCGRSPPARLHDHAWPVIIRSAR